MLVNPGFEADWSDEKSHRCLIIPEGGSPYEADVGNIFTPPGWLAWFHHDPGTWDQPEVRDAWGQQDHRRAHGGQKGIVLFTFSRRHDAGFLQQVPVEVGTQLRFSAYAHAWSNHRDPAYPDRFPHPDDAWWSEGCGWSPRDGHAGQYDGSVNWRFEGETSDDQWRNFIFRVGIDPTGGTNPLSDTVVWGIGIHEYNEFVQPVPAVEVEAQADAVTVFLRSTTLWPFKHNDAYWDDAELVVVDEPPPPPPPPGECRGSPRVQYPRTVILLPPESGWLWVTALSDVVAEYQTGVTYSADDAGIGDLDVRRIIAVNSHLWPDDLEEFFKGYYPGVEYYHVAADLEDVADAVNEVLEEIEYPPPPPPPPPPEEPPWADMEVITLHVQQPTAHDGYGDLEFVRDVQPAGFKVVGHMQQLQRVKAVSPDTVTIYRQFVDNQGLYWDNPSPQQGAREFLYTFLDSLLELQDFVDLVEGLNEIGVPNEIARLSEWYCWFAEALVEEGLLAAPLMLSIPVGNPQHPEEGGLAHIEEMLPAVRKAVELGGAIGYHGYHRVCNGAVDPPWDSNWYHYAGRCLESWDPVFNEHGLYPNYVISEAGAFLNALAGWKHGDVFGGNWSAYAQSILELRDRINAWNTANNYRAICYTLFTYANPGVWQYYNLYGYARALAEALT